MLSKDNSKYFQNSELKYAMKNKKRSDAIHAGEAARLLLQVCPLLHLVVVDAETS
jgi:hypothetical protein